eukprot:TRINITY_DN71112_c0_g1_i2.p1 TRINITY_DN71112_c0_g1~~TRINITY_DN71112_c0_g1_i2.p1  ORF type:complete len:254 (+),score=29.81 TRINITY_DN71112_c0_g1_i2:85-846(+)
MELQASQSFILCNPWCCVLLLTLAVLARQTHVGLIAMAFLSRVRAERSRASVSNETEHDKVNCAGSSMLGLRAAREAREANALPLTQTESEEYALLQVEARTLRGEIRRLRPIAHNASRLQEQLVQEREELGKTVLAFSQGRGDGYDSLVGCGSSVPCSEPALPRPASYGREHFRRLSAQLGAGGSDGSSPSTALSIGPRVSEDLDEARRPDTCLTSATARKLYGREAFKTFSRSLSVQGFAPSGDVEDREAG